MVPPALVDLFHRRLQPDLDQPQEVPIADPARERLEELGMWDAVERDPTMIPLSTTRLSCLRTRSR
jgi:hypothetical protein